MGLGLGWGLSSAKTERTLDGKIHTHWDKKRVWDTQTDLDDIDIGAQVDIETEVFWDAQTNLDDVDTDAQTEIEAEVYWDTQTEVSVNNQTEPSEGESVIIQAASSDEF